MLIPATRYKDCEAALEFLTTVLGLRAHAVFRDDSGHIVHAQMALGSGLMMFGPPNDGPFDRFMTDPADTDGRETTTIYAVVPDIGARFAHVADRCEAMGGRILLPLEAQDHGGAAFSLADPEGHIWTFGDYHPNGNMTQAGGM